jgi:hypothetical protein
MGVDWFSFLCYEYHDAWGLEYGIMCIFCLDGLRERHWSGIERISRRDCYYQRIDTGTAFFRSMQRRHLCLYRSCSLMTTVPITTVGHWM